MTMSICTDAQGRVTGVCPDNLSGGIGWVWTECALTPSDNLTDERGTALYTCIGGVVSTRTAEEIAADSSAQPTPEMTDVEKLKIRQDATEDAILFLMGMNMGGMI